MIDRAQRAVYRAAVATNEVLQFLVRVCDGLEALRDRRPTPDEQPEQSSLCPHQASAVLDAFQPPGPPN